MSQVHPTVRYLLLCEDVQTDPHNPRRVTLVGLIGAIRSLEQPPYSLLYRELCVFLQLTECRGAADGRIEVQDADSGQVVFRTMTNQVNATADCLVVGEYVDEAEDAPTGAAHRSEVVRPNVVADYVDVWERTGGLREFTVLLKDGRVVIVRGQRLKNELPQAPIFSIVVGSGEEEAIVALFRSDDISAIFHGELVLDRKTA